MLKFWNAKFMKEERDAYMDCYPTTPETLPERLSEMFHFDRRGYIVASALQEAIIPVLDIIDSSAKGEGRVDFVVNRDGVFTGYFLNLLHSDQVEAIEALWKRR